MGSTLARRREPDAVGRDPRQVAHRGSFQEMIGNLGEQVVEGCGHDALAMIVPTDQGFESDE